MAAGSWKEGIIDLCSGHPWWIANSGLLHSYPALHEDAECDVLIVGAGISGALIADLLSAAGMRVCVIDRREAGWGSTSASTALLQYEIDTELNELSDLVGIDNAVLAYRACEKAVLRLGELALGLRGVGFRRMQSLYLASRGSHEKRLRAEATLRREHGFRVQTIEPEGVRAQFGIDAPVALLTSIAAETDPYRLAHALLARVRRRDGGVHGRTELAEFRPQKDDVLAHTTDGHAIRCQHLIFAAGYECQSHLDQRVACNRSSYALVSEPVDKGIESLRKTLMWESARPYLYLRTTPDNRVIAGGLDDSVDIAIKRDASVPEEGTDAGRPGPHLVARAVDACRILLGGYVRGNQRWTAFLWPPSATRTSCAFRYGLRRQRHYLQHDWRGNTVGFIAGQRSPVRGLVFVSQAGRIEGPKPKGIHDQ